MEPVISPKIVINHMTRDKPAMHMQYVSEACRKRNGLGKGRYLALGNLGQIQLIKLPCIKHLFHTKMAGLVLLYIFDSLLSFTLNSRIPLMKTVLDQKEIIKKKKLSID